MLDKIVNKVIKALKLNRKEVIINEIIQKKLTYLSKEALSLILNTTKDIKINKIKGDFVETGCALGGSSILIAKFKNKNRKFKIFDSFEMMPEPTDNDERDVHERFDVIKKGKSKGINGDSYYGYEKKLLDKVKNNFKSFNIDCESKNVEFIKGYYEDTLYFNKEIAFAHIDCDWYDSVKVSLERIVPHLVLGGMLIIDDYYYYSGCKKATDEYFSDKKNQFEFIKKERLVIKKIK